MAMAVGRGWAYYIVSITITIVLALAANTSFGGLPVLASLVARDNYLPHLFTIRGDRQTFAQRHRACSPSWRARCSSPSTATPTR